MESQAKLLKRLDGARFGCRKESKKGQQSFIHRSDDASRTLPRSAASCFNRSPHLNVVVILVLFVVSLQFPIAETTVYSSATDIRWHIPLDKRKFY